MTPSWCDTIAFLVVHRENALILSGRHFFSQTQAQSDEVAISAGVERGRGGGEDQDG